MNIKSNGNASFLFDNNINSPQNRKDNAIKGIEKQIKSIQEQMSKLSEKEGTSHEEKIDMQKKLKEQLEELNKKLIQITIESQQKEREKTGKEMQQQVQDDDSVSNIREKNLILLSSSLKQISLQSSIGTKMKGEARVLASEIKLDEGRGLDVTSKKEDLAEINLKVENINKKMEEKLKTVNEKINKSNEKTNVKDDSEEDNGVLDNEVSNENLEASNKIKPKDKIDVLV